MNAYDIVLFFHLMGLAAMFSAFAVYLRAGSRLRAATDMAQVRSWLGLLESTRPMFASGSVMLLLSGIYMMATRIRAPHPWIIVPFIGLLTIWILGATVSGRYLRDVRAAAAETHGSISEERSFRISNPFPWTVVSTLNGLAAGIIFVPGWAGSLGFADLGAMIGAVIGTRAVRRPRRSPAMEARTAQS